MKDVLRNRKEQGDKGFSLVELAVVIAIIAVLVAIAVPVFIGMNQAAEEATQKANAANGSSMIAATIAKSANGSIPLGSSSSTAGDGTAFGELKRLNGVTATVALNPTTDTAVTLTNYCVTVGAAKSGPGCTP